MIIFKNKGAIDPRAIKIMGASVKKENAIGYFGTGLKYAIAICLREGCPITIYSGGTKYDMSTKKVLITGVEFDVVHMNGEELGFTTEQGKKWKLWQAFRELYCNCTDEGGTIYGGRGDDISCGPDETIITVEGEHIEKIFAEVGSFILQDVPDYQNEHIEIRKRPTQNLFYRGVMVKDDLLPSMMQYNIKMPITLTEDRTAKYIHEVEYAVERGIVTMTDKELLHKALLAPEFSFEHGLDYRGISAEPSKEFLEICKFFAESHEDRANQAAISYAQKYLDMKTEPTEFELSPMQRKQIERAEQLLHKAGFQVDQYPRKYVRKLGVGTLALAKDGVVWVSETAFLKGTQVLAHALLEETWHLQHGFDDGTRTFQNFLFDNILSLIERVNEEAF